jgi:hypothetical protein
MSGAKAWSAAEIAFLKRTAAAGASAKDIALFFPRRTPHGVRVKMLRVGIRLKLIRARLGRAR